MSDFLEKLLTVVFGIAITFAIGLLVYHFLPGAAQAWIQAQVNTIFAAGNSVIGNAVNQ